MYRDNSFKKNFLKKKRGGGLCQLSLYIYKLRNIQWEWQKGGKRLSRRILFTAGSLEISLNLTWKTNHFKSLSLSLMEEEITVMNSIRHFCFTLTFLGNAVILIHLLNMMQTQMSLAEYKDWKYGQNSLDFLKKNCDFLELCCCCEIYLRSHCMLIIPCKRSVLYGWKKLDVFFLI